MPAYDDEETPGLAGERTDLAWSRSGLAALAAVAAMVKLVVDVEEATAPALVVALLAGGAVAWGLALAHARAIAATTLAGRAHADQAKLRTVAIGTAALALGALVLAIVPSR